MLAEERRLKLIEWTRVDGRLDAADAAEKLEVAVETVRRDLEILQKRGALRRVHGGAIALERFAHEFTLPERMGQNLSQKQAIGAVAANYIPTEGMIFVDGGTTTECMASYLRDRPKLTVVTNSVPLVAKLADSSTNTVMLGGRVRPATLSAVGAKTITDLQELNAVVSFIGANGVSLDGGVTAYDSDEALVKKAMMRNSLEKVLLVDEGKFGATYPARFADFSSFDRLVTNVTTNAKFVDAFASGGTEVAFA